MGLDSLSDDEEEDELDEESVPTGRDRQRRKRGRLGDWEKIGWMAARYCRRVPGVEFM